MVGQQKMIIGLLTTAFSFVRGSKIAMYGLMAAGAALAFYIFVRSQRRAGAAEAILKAAQAAAERMERSRAIHQEIKRLPLADRASRLRRLDASR
jgi:hypothetical protein